jgi:SAM-dependent methyltransferase
MDHADLLQDVAAYYARKLRRYGPTPAGVDWRDAVSQQTRFEQLCNLIGEPEASVLDLGCGYGAMLDFLRGRGFTGVYCGLDVAPEMIEIAKARHASDARAEFDVGSGRSFPVDYALASGIFNVRQQRADADWQQYVTATLATMDRVSTKGFAFNCLTSYSDTDKMKPELFYGDPCFYFDLCKRAYSRHVALLHDYGLFEFTLIVRKVL